MTDIVGRGVCVRSATEAVVNVWLTAFKAHQRAMLFLVAFGATLIRDCTVFNEYVSVQALMLHDSIFIFFDGNKQLVAVLTKTKSTLFIYKNIPELEAFATLKLSLANFHRVGVFFASSLIGQLRRFTLLTEKRAALEALFNCRPWSTAWVAFVNFFVLFHINKSMVVGAIIPSIFKGLRGTCLWHPLVADFA